MKIKLIHSFDSIWYFFQPLSPYKCCSIFLVSFYIIYLVCSKLCISLYFSFHKTKSCNFCVYNSLHGRLEEKICILLNQFWPLREKNILAPLIDALYQSTTLVCASSLRFFFLYNFILILILICFAEEEKAVQQVQRVNM